MSLVPRSEICNQQCIGAGGMMSTPGICAWSTLVKSRARWLASINACEGVDLERNALSLTVPVDRAVADKQAFNTSAARTMLMLLHRRGRCPVPAMRMHVWLADTLLPLFTTVVSTRNRPRRAAFWRAAYSLLTPQSDAYAAQPCPVASRTRL